MNQIEIGAAAQTALKEALIKSKKKQRFVLDCQHVIKTIILNLIEKNTSEIQFGKACIMPCTKTHYWKSWKSANPFRLVVDGLSSHKKITTKIADNAKFQFNEMQKVLCEKHFGQFIKFDYLNDRLDVFLGKYFFSRGRSVACV